MEHWAGWRLLGHVLGLAIPSFLWDFAQDVAALTLGQLSYLLPQLLVSKEVINYDSYSSR